MKKLFVAFAFMLGFAGIASAQTKMAPAKVKEVTTKTAVTTKTTPAAASTTKTPAAVKTPAATKATTTTDAVKLKADGTPDKRYKAATTKGPVKADGTPYKRFKANKK